METKTVIIKLRQDTSSNWSRLNPILDVGEPAWDITSRKMKVGTGITAWNDLPFVGQGSFAEPNEHGTYSDTPYARVGDSATEGHWVKTYSQDTIDSKLLNAVSVIQQDLATKTTALQVQNMIQLSINTFKVDEVNKKRNMITDVPVDKILIYSTMRDSNGVIQQTAIQATDDPDINVIPLYNNEKKLRTENADIESDGDKIVINVKNLKDTINNLEQYTRNYVDKTNFIQDINTNYSQATTYNQNVTYYERIGQVDNYDYVVVEDQSIVNNENVTQFYINNNECLENITEIIYQEDNSNNNIPKKLILNLTANNEYAKTVKVELDETISYTESATDNLHKGLYEFKFVSRNVIQDNEDTPTYISNVYTYSCGTLKMILTRTQTIATSDITYTMKLTDTYHQIDSKYSNELNSIIDIMVVCTNESNFVDSNTVGTKLTELSGQMTINY